jgi:ATP-dependent RNA helicase SUPV3L1/SUV3
VARLVRGRSLIAPEIEILRNDLLDNASREAVRARLSGWLDRHLRKRLGPLFRAHETELAAPARGLVFQLSERLGAVPRRQVRSLVAAMGRADRAALAALGLRFGAQSVFFPALLKPAAQQLRLVLWNAHRGDAAEPESDPATGAIVPCQPASRAPAGCWAALGYSVIGPLALRCDRIELLSARLHRDARRGPVPATEALSALAGCSGEALATVAESLGFRVRQQDGVATFVAKRRPGRGGNGAATNAELDAPPRARGRRKDAHDPASPFAALRTLVPAK